MCSVCGCSGGGARIVGHGHHHDDGDPDHGRHRHHGGHQHSHSHDRLDQSGESSETSRLITIEQSILAKNQAYADSNRSAWNRDGLFVINVISSPGAGKTTLLVETIKSLRRSVAVGVVEGDQETSNDADRIRATGVGAIQINTGRGCHLDAHTVGHAAESLALAPGGVMFIENVGNLVCPTGFDLGEDKRIVLLSVTEGDDKPLKYPDAFASSDVMVLGKMDLAAYVNFDVEKACALARDINPQIEIFRLSATTGDGMDQWLAWIETGARKTKGVQCTN
jgi:hydrogenase nickel incorporation protein HypB